MSKVDFDQLGLTLEKLGKFIESIEDFLTAVPESVPMQVALFDAAWHWSEHIITEKLKNYPHKYCVSYQHYRNDIPYNFQESPKLRKVTPEMLKTRNILNSAVEVHIFKGYDETRNCNLPSHYAIVLIDNHGNFAWDFFELDGNGGAIWLAGDTDEELNFPRKL